MEDDTKNLSLEMSVEMELPEDEKKFSDNQELKESDKQLEDYMQSNQVSDPESAGECSKERKKQIYSGKELHNVGNKPKLENELKRLRLENKHLKKEKKLLLQVVNEDVQETESSSNDEDKDVLEEEPSASNYTAIRETELHYNFKNNNCY